MSTGVLFESFHDTASPVEPTTLVSEIVVDRLVRVNGVTKIIFRYRTNHLNLF